MHKYLLRLLPVMLLSLQLVSCESKNTPPDWPFEMSFPTDWHLDESREPELDTFHVYRNLRREETEDEYTFIGIVVFWHSDLLRAQTWEDYIKFERANFEEKGYQVTDINIELSESHPSFIFLVESEKAKSYDVYFKKDYDCIAISFECPREEWGKYESVFKRAIRSFKFR